MSRRIYGVLDNFSRHQVVASYFACKQYVMMRRNKFHNLCLTTFIMSAAKLLLCLLPDFVAKLKHKSSSTRFATLRNAAQIREQTATDFRAQCSERL